MYDFLDFLREAVAPIFIVLMLLFTLLMIPVIAGSYYSSCKQANVFNGINNTTYSCSDFFWASNQINTNTQTIKLK